MHSWNKSTSRLRARQSPEKQLTRSGQMTPAPRLWHGKTPDSEEEETPFGVAGGNYFLGRCLLSPVRSLALSVV